MKFIVEVISCASIILPPPLAFSWIFYFPPWHPRDDTQEVPYRSDFGSGGVCPKPSWRRSSCNLPGAFPMQRRSRWYCLAAGVWLHSAASPPAATSPREQIWAHSFHIYRKTPGPLPPPLVPSHVMSKVSHCQGGGDVGATLPPLIASGLGVSLLNWASLTFMFASISQVVPPAWTRASGLFASCGDMCRTNGRSRTSTAGKKMRAFPPGKQGGQVSMLEIVQLARNVLWLTVFCSWAARRHVKVDRGGNRIQCKNTLM